MLYRLYQFIPSFCLTHLYYAFIQPYIDYCLLIWGHTSKSNILRIQRFQNRVARVVTRNFDTNSSGLQLVKSLGWFNVAQRLDYLCVLLMYKCVKGEAPNYLSDHVSFLSDIQSITCISTRTSDLDLHIPFAKTAFLSKSFNIYAAKLWNDLPFSIRQNNNVIYFKKLYKKYVLESWHNTFIMC